MNNRFLLWLYWPPYFHKASEPSRLLNKVELLRKRQAQSGSELEISLGGGGRGGEERAPETPTRKTERRTPPPTLTPMKDKQAAEGLTWNHTSFRKAGNSRAVANWDRRCRWRSPWQKLPARSGPPQHAGTLVWGFRKQWVIICSPTPKCPESCEHSLYWEAVTQCEGWSFLKSPD